MSNRINTTASLASPASPGAGCRRAILAMAVAAALGMSFPVCADQYLVNQATDDGTGDVAGTLSWAILQANTHSGSDTISLGGSITITGVMKRLINSDLTIQSAGSTIHSISGGNIHRPLFIKSGTVQLQNLQFEHGLAQGGGSGVGGGGGGLGGAIFVEDGNLIIDSVSFTNNAASGGSAGLGSGRPGEARSGGGMYGSVFGFGGGGLFADTTHCTEDSFLDCDISGAYGGLGAYGGFGGSVANGRDGGFAGGGGYGTHFSDVGGNGGFGGGAGGGYYSGGYGGFGGGGGYSTNSGGSGGFAGGGGGGWGYFGGTGPAPGGWGAGDGNTTTGGGGAGLGGAIFIKQGVLTLRNAAFNSNSANPGTGASPGEGRGGAIFICSATEGGTECDGAVSATSCSVSFNANTAVTGEQDVFGSFPPSATEICTNSLTVTPPAHGLISGSGIYCGTGGDNCSSAYPLNATATLQMVADHGWAFDNWTGDCSGTATSCDLTFDTSKSIGADFHQLSFLLNVVPAVHGKVTGNGINCGSGGSSDCSESYLSFSTENLTATPDPGWEFTGWTGDCDGSSCSITMDGDKTVTPVFHQLDFSLTVTAPLHGIVTGPGIDCGSGAVDCTENYASFTVVDLTVVADSGWAFANWTGDCSGAGCQLNMDGAKSVGVDFAQLSYDLTIEGGPPPHGTITGNGINCGTGGTDCSQSYLSWTPVTLTVTPDSAYQFDNWGGNCQGTDLTCDLTMNAHQKVVAFFSEIRYQLSVVPIPFKGTVTSDYPIDDPNHDPNSDLIFCSSVVTDRCVVYRTVGTVVPMYASADPGWAFGAWTGACLGVTARPCELTVESDLALSADFSQLSYTLEVTPPTEGKITGNGIDCGADSTGDCSETYLSGSQIDLTATPAAGWQFLNWGGDCSGNVCQLTMDGGKSVSAGFTQLSYQLQVSPVPIGGSITSETLIDCGSSGAICSANYDSGTPIILTASPDKGWEFVGWSGDCSTATGTECLLTMNSPVNLSASFNQLSYLLSVDIPVDGKITGNGIDCGGGSEICSATYLSGSTINLTATPIAGYELSSWGDDCSGSGTGCTLTMDGRKDASAVFSQSNYPLTVTPPTHGKITGTGGIDCGITSCSEDYPSFTDVTLTAHADQGWALNSWIGDCSGSTLTCALNMDAAKNASVDFYQLSYTLTITTPDNGRITGNGIDCGSGGAQCSNTYLSGTPITLTATPDAGWTFDTWGADSDCAGESGNSCQLTMDSDMDASSAFSQLDYTLTVTTPAHGKITSSEPDGIDCGATCSKGYSSFTDVILTATADAGWALDNWTGDCTGSASDCILNMDAGKSVGANFYQLAYTLTVTSPVLNGKITANGISCGSDPIDDCEEDYFSGSNVSLTATSDAGWEFSSWGGACSGATGSVCDITMVDVATVTASFTQLSYTLTVNPPDFGTVTGTGGIDCGPGATGVCTQDYLSNDTVELLATAEAGYVYSAWTNDCSGAGDATCQLNMTSDKVAGVNFDLVPIDQYALTITLVGDGQVTSVDGYINCGGGHTDCSHSYYDGDNVTLSASGSAGWVFDSWSGGYCSGNGSCMLTMDVDKGTTATFNQLDYLLSVPISPVNGNIISSEPGGIDCGTTLCSKYYPSFTDVTLSAVADSSYVFSGWTGDCSGAAGALCQLNMNSDPKEVGVAFDPVTINKRALSITLSGNGQVVSDDGFITCGLGMTDCSYIYPTATEVTLIATPESQPDSNWEFTGWSGDCSGNTSCAVTLDVDRAATASFTQLGYPFTVPTPLVNGKITGIGIDCGADTTNDCDEDYLSGAEVQLTATANMGWAFDSWVSGVCDDDSVNPCSFTMTAAKALEVNFVENSLTVTKPTNGMITGAGISCGSAGTDCTEPYFDGEIVALSAEADSGWEFIGWLDACTSSGNSCQLTMDGSLTASGNFSQLSYNLEIDPEPVGGTVTDKDNPANISCGSSGDTCIHSYLSYPSNGPVTLNAAADTGWAFTQWNGACTGVAVDCSVQMTNPKLVWATFTQDIYTLTVDPPSHGTITGNGINCDSSETQCSNTYLSGTPVTLTASPDAGWAFATWGGACDGVTGNSCQLAMDRDLGASSSFIQLNYPLTVTSPARGKITGTGGIDCGAACSKDYPSYTDVTLAAHADQGWALTGWSGACSGSAATCNLNMDGAKSASASFYQLSYALTVTEPHMGKVTGNGIDCGSGGVQCSNTYYSGTPVTLTASPDAGWTFATWGDACTGSSGISCQLTMDSSLTASGSFSQLSYNLEISPKPMGGTIKDKDNPANINCGSNGDICIHSYLSNGTVTLNAVADRGWEFTRWNGACTHSNADCAVSMTNPRLAWATFTQLSYTLTVSEPANGKITGNGIDCGSGGTQCSNAYLSGTGVILSAIPDSGWAFSTWGNACASSSGSSCQLTMDSNLTASGSFSQLSYNLEISPEPVGGTVTDKDNPANISCGSNGDICLHSYLSNGTVTLNAAADKGWEFTLWNGACTHSEADCAVNMTNPSLTGATFTQLIYTLTVTPPEHGTIAGNGINCSSDGTQCSHTYLSGTQVTLNASPVAGWVFDTWGDACVNETGSSCELSMDSSLDVSGNFTQLSYNLEISPKPVGGIVTDKDDPANISCGSNGDTCLHSYLSNGTVMLSAAADTGWEFTRWNGACTHSDADCAVNMTNPRLAWATFTQLFYTLKVNLPVNGKITGNGIDCGSGASDCKEDYLSGTPVALTSTADAGWQWSAWTDNCVASTTNVCQLTMDNETETVGASFSQLSYPLTISTPSNGKITSSESDGIDCGTAKCGKDYLSFTDVTLTAAADGGWGLSGWSGACSGNSATCNLHMDGARNAGASFYQLSYTLSVTEPTNGRITGNGIDCGSGGTQCSNTYLSGSSVELNALPNAGWLFDEWGTDCSGSSCQVLMDNNKVVSADFSQIPVFTLYVTEPLHGQVTGDGIDCGAGSVDCSETYLSGTHVTLGITTDSGWVFVGWTGCNGIANACQLVMDQSHTVSTEFTQQQYILTVSKPDNGNVTGPGIDCGAGTDCTENYPTGELVELSAIGHEGWEFVAWNGDCTGDTCQLSMDGDKSVSAAFEEAEVLPPVCDLTRPSSTENCTLNQDIIEVSNHEIVPPTIAKFIATKSVTLGKEFRVGLGATLIIEINSP